MGIRVPLICVEGFVAKEIESVPVKVAAAAASSDRDRCAAIPALFGSSVVGRDFELGRVVGSNAVKIRDGIGNARLVGLDAVNRDVLGTIA